MEYAYMPAGVVAEIITAPRNVVTESQAAKLDESGDSVLDAEGNQVFETVSDTVAFDIAELYHPDFVAQLIPVNEATGAVGLGNVLIDGKFAPAPAPVVVPQTVFSVREFTKRFTIPEQVEIREAQMTDMQVGLVYDDFNRAQFIDLNDPAVAQGLEFYVSKELITSARKAEILAA